MTWVAGQSPTAEHRQKLSDSLKGRPKSDSHRENISLAKQREKNPAWQGGRFLHRGYVYINVGRDHPMANQNGCALEHRLVMSGIVGRSLTPDETVHHINGDKADNRPENLQLRKGRHGKGVSYMCGDCGSINILSAGLGV